MSLVLMYYIILRGGYFFVNIELILLLLLTWAIYAGTQLDLAFVHP